VSLNIGVGDRGSQKMSVPSASAVMIRLPVGECVSRQHEVNDITTPPSGVNSPHCTGPVCPANTCMVLPEGTIRSQHKI
jgi:hypothetical protein